MIFSRSEFPKVVGGWGKKKKPISSIRDEIGFFVYLVTVILKKMVEFYYMDIITSARHLKYTRIKIMNRCPLLRS